MELPANVGAYRVLGAVDEGGMGRVLRARHRTELIAERQGGDVAVKVMHPQLALKDSFRTRFEQEATVGLKLKHPGIVRVHDLVVDGDVLALVMELVDGLPLSKVFAGRAVAPLQVLELVRQIAEALDHAHDAGVVHRDLKPANVMVDGSGKARVLDFGIAKEHEGSTGTRTGMGMGTVAYMAPEQYRDAKRVDRRADVYALAMMAYEMLAGRLPWDEPLSEFELLRRKADGDLPGVRVHASGLGPAVEEVLSMGLASEATERFATATAFSNALKSAVAPGAMGPQRIERPDLVANQTLHPDDFVEAPEKPVSGPAPKKAPPTPRKAPSAPATRTKAPRPKKSRRQLARGRGTDGLAVASFVLSLVSLVSCMFPISLLSLVMGVASAWRINGQPERYTGGGLAGAAIVMALIGSTVHGFFWLVFLLEAL